MAEAPFCPVEQPPPPARPHKPAALEQIPPNATIQQITRVINNNINIIGPRLMTQENFLTLLQDPVFIRNLINNINNTTRRNNLGGQEIEVSRSTETVRVENPSDSSQFVDIERINTLNMRNATTGETWFWKRER